MIVLCNPNFRWSVDREVPYGGDFLQEWVAGDMLLTGMGSAIYDPIAFAERQHAVSRTGFRWPERDFYPAVYPPTYYCLVAPLAALPYRAAAPVWLAIMLVAFALSAWITERATRSQLHAGSEKFSTIFWCVTLLFPALFMGLVMGQKGTLWCLFAAASWQLWRLDKPFAAGCAWSLLSMKPTLCFVLPLVMLAHRQWRFCAGMLAGTVLLCAVTALIAPAGMWSGYWEVVAGSIDYQSHRGYRSGWSASLWSLLRACGCSPRATLCLAGVAGVVMLAALWKLRPAAKQAGVGHADFQLRVLLTTALLSPHFYFYDLVWLLLPIAALLKLEPRRALLILAVLWGSILVVQRFDHGWPMLSVVLVALLAHSTLRAKNCGTSFAISNRALATA
jgi:hypothetical protein